MVDVIQKQAKAQFHKQIILRVFLNVEMGGWSLGAKAFSLHTVDPGSNLWHLIWPLKYHQWSLLNKELRTAP